MNVEPDGTLGTSAMVTEMRCCPITGANMRPMPTKARAGRMGRTFLSNLDVTGNIKHLQEMWTPVLRPRLRLLKPRPLDLVLEVAPDAVHDLAVARVVAQLQHVARPLQRDVDDGLGAARAR